MQTRSMSGGRGMVAISFDDYHPLNTKIADLLEQYGLKATFYIETATPEARSQIAELSSRGHEIGCHTIHHPSDMKALHHVEVVSEVEGAKSMIEGITGKPCTTFAYPRGRFNDDVVEIVRRAGFTHARTTHVLKTEWDDPLRMPTTVHLYDGRKEYNERDWSSLSRFYMEHVIKNGGTFSVWGHASEIERDRMWERLDYLLAFIKKSIV